MGHCQKWQLKTPRGLGTVSFCLDLTFKSWVAYVFRKGWGGNDGWVRGLSVQDFIWRLLTKSCLELWGPHSSSILSVSTRMWVKVLEGCREGTYAPHCGRWGKQAVNSRKKTTAKTHKKRERGCLLCRNKGGRMVVRVCILWHIVYQGPFSGFVGYENCWRNGERCRMGFHRLSLLLYHAGDWRREECSGSRRCTSSPEKQGSQSCVKIYRLPCRSLWTFVYVSAVNFHSGSHIVLWAYLFMGVLSCLALQYHRWAFDGEHWPAKASSVCMPSLPGGCASTPRRLRPRRTCRGTYITQVPLWSPVSPCVSIMKIFNSVHSWKDFCVCD